MTKQTLTEPTHAPFTAPPRDRDPDVPVLAMAHTVSAPGVPADGLAEVRATLRAGMTRGPEPLAVSEGDIVDLSLWESPLDVRAFVHGRHQDLLRLRRRWGLPADAVTRVLWWVAPGHTPDHAEAAARLRHLREFGPDREAFTLRSPVPPPQVSRRASTAAARSSG
ncbi:DUF3291 domain-containing protein [Spiractinospora alimapuensis]|uniref:DUF3291 domain-containing protein n=1 Tax=Spiractinospora alimapuensis TaxID=2820884 RepID=UPI001F1EB39E|nr:DUF3291 domain-containing protein [Spiractinospora alimapuensis]QVQ53119.1 DUF3291 domain-containing protein [Spiractinospora alimapuensis]